MVRQTVLVMSLLAVALIVKTPPTAQAAERLDAESIKMALHVTDQENDGFVERVVELMNEGQLSRASVTIAFGKARNRVDHKFQYFKRAMTELAKREGVCIARPISTPPAKQNWWQTFLARVRHLATLGRSG